MIGLEDKFGAVYRGLLSRIEPDPDRLRLGLGAVIEALARAGPEDSVIPPLHFPEKCDIQETDAREGFCLEEEREEEP